MANIIMLFGAPSANCLVYDGVSTESFIFLLDRLLRKTFDRPMTNLSYIPICFTSLDILSWEVTKLGYCVKNEADY